MIKARLLLVWIILTLKIKIDLHLWVSTIGKSVEVASLVLDVAWQQSTLVQIWALVDCLISWRVKLYHHGWVHLWSGGVHSCCINVVQCSEACRCVLCTLPIDLKHILILILLIIHMSMNRYVLNVIVILLFAAECQLCALIKLVRISLPRNIHHDKVFSCSIKFVRAALFSVVISNIDTQIAIVSWRSHCTIIQTINRKTHNILLPFMSFRWLMQKVGVRILNTSRPCMATECRASDAYVAHHTCRSYAS